MVSNEIVKYGNDILRQKAVEVTEINDEIHEIIEVMYKALEETRGVGVAGPQVGVSKRMFVYDIGEGHHALINPKIIKSRGEETSVEGCLSIPGLQGEVSRATMVIVTGIDEEGKKVKIRATDFLARVFQHEIDHLDGTMFIDKADPETLETIPLNEEDDELEPEE